MIRLSIPLSLAALLAAAAVGRAQTGCPGGTGSPIAITNLKPKETVNYDLLLVKGTVGAGALSVNLSAGGETSAWPVGGGVFKGLVRLKPGVNQVAVSAAGHQNACAEIAYVPNRFANQIRMAYVAPKGLLEDSPRFRAPAGEPADLASLKKRLGFAAMLQQSLVAELLAKAGKPRMAPHIVRDAAGEPEILVLESDKTAAELEANNSLGAWDYAKKALEPHQDGRTRFQVFFAKVPGAWRMDNGVLSSLENAYAWPQDASELVSRYTDRRTPKELGVPGSNDTVSLASWVKSDYGFWFKIAGLWALDVPNVDTVSKDPFGRASGHLNTFFMVKNELGADLKEDYSLSAVTSAGLPASPWLTQADPPRLPALPRASLPAVLVPGVAYKYHEGSFKGLPDFSTLVPAATGVLSNFGLEPRKRDDNIAFVFDAWVEIPRSGPWLFQLSSDDGSRLLLDGKVLIDNDSTHPERRIMRGTALDSGLHHIQVQYFNGVGGRALGLQWTSASVPLQPIPTSALRREQAQTAIRPMAAFGGPHLVRKGGEVRLRLDRGGPIDLILIAPSGRFAGTLFQGALPAGDHRFVLPPTAAGESLLPVLKAH